MDSGGPSLLGETVSSINPVDKSTTDASVDADIIREPVIDGQLDIAITFDSVQMKVEAVGRVPLQKVWLWDGPPHQKGSTTGGKNLAYDAEKDLNQNPSRLPTKEELTEGPSTRPYLEVGIVIGAQPDKYVSTGQRSKAKEEEKKNRGILPRNPTATRVFIPTSSHIASQAKYYMGVHPQGGRTHPRTIDASFIFFYPEFWIGLNGNANKKEKMAFVNGQTKHFAARQKIGSLRSQAPITVDEQEKLASSNPLAVTAIESVRTTISLMWAQYHDTKDIQYIDHILESLERPSPGLRYGSQSSTDGVDAFFDFDQGFSMTDAEQLKRELQSIIPKVSCELILQVRAKLVEKEWTDLVQPDELVSLLSTTQWLIGWEKLDGPFEFLLEVALGLVVNNARTTPHTSRLASVPNFGDDTTRVIVAAFRDEQMLLLNRRDEKARALANQHGGITAHATMHELMKKGGEAIDVATQQNILEQIARIHAVQWTAGQNDEREYHVKRIAMLDQILAYRGTGH